MKKNFLVFIVLFLCMGLVSKAQQPANASYPDETVLRFNLEQLVRNMGRGMSSHKSQPKDSADFKKYRCIYKIAPGDKPFYYETGNPVKGIYIDLLHEGMTDESLSEKMFTNWLSRIEATMTDWKAREIKKIGESSIKSFFTKETNPFAIQLIRSKINGSWNISLVATEANFQEEIILKLLIPQNVVATKYTSNEEPITNTKSTKIQDLLKQINGQEHDDPFTVFFTTVFENAKNDYKDIRGKLIDSNYQTHRYKSKLADYQGTKDNYIWYKNGLYGLGAAYCYVTPIEIGSSSISAVTGKWRATIAKAIKEDEASNFEEWKTEDITDKQGIRIITYTKDLQLKFDNSIKSGWRITLKINPNDTKQSMLLFEGK